jgi:hypothetical protein
MFIEGRMQIIDRKSQPHSLHRELFYLVAQQPATFATCGRRRTEHHGADAGSCVEEAFGRQLSDHFVRGVGMDLSALLSARTDGKESPGRS